MTYATRNTNAHTTYSPIRYLILLTILTLINSLHCNTTTNGTLNIIHYLCYLQRLHLWHYAYLNYYITTILVILRENCKIKSVFNVQWILGCVFSIHWVTLLTRPPCLVKLGLRCEENLFPSEENAWAVLIVRFKGIFFNHCIEYFARGFLNY